MTRLFIDTKIDEGISTWEIGGDNARYLRYALTAFEQPPIDIADSKQVEKRISESFAFCLDNVRTHRDVVSSKVVAFFVVDMDCR